MKAIVKQIQVGGSYIASNLEDACVEFCRPKHDYGIPKIHFLIELPNGETKFVTIRDEDSQTVAYGDFEDLPSFTDYAKDIENDIAREVRNERGAR